MSKRKATAKKKPAKRKDSAIPAKRKGGAAKKKTAKRKGTAKPAHRKAAAAKKKPAKRKAASKTKAAKSRGLGSSRKKRGAAGTTSIGSVGLSLGMIEDDESGLFLPREAVEPVEPKKIRKGLEKAKSEITALMGSLTSITDGFSISEVEMSASFSADGKFLGVGVGGATTIKIKFRPEN